ncbi:MAG: AI-2E family transporter [Syntrophomonadaceae bacterium]|nr:AI-2E family transporter [Syntrophomonadaceae bacterium]
MLVNTSKLFRYVLFFLVVVTTIYFLFLVREILFIFAVGAVLAYLLFRPVSFIERRGVKRVWAILILYLATLIFLLAFFSFAVPGIVRELSELADLIPVYASEVQDIADKMGKIQMPGKLSDILRGNLIKIENSVYLFLKRFVGGIYDFLGKIFAIIFSPILAFYIMNDWEKIRDGCLNMLSPRARREITILFKQIDSVLIEFFKGHFIVAVFVGTMIGISAAVLGVKFPLLLGILSGITNLIPYFGAFLGGVPAVAVALSQSLPLAVYMTIAILVVQQLEGSIITPKIIGDRLGMHPLLIVFSLLTGGKLLGVWGMLVAVPLAATLKVLAGWAYLKAVDK